MAAPEKVTWAQVCQQVRMGDTLYPTCRQKVPGFSTYPALAEPPGPEPETDFSKEIESDAVPIPPPPPAGAQPAAPQGPWGAQQGSAGLSSILQGETSTKLLWAAVGALVLMLLMNSKKPEEQKETAAKPA